MADYVDETGQEYTWSDSAAPADTRATDGVVDDAQTITLIDYTRPIPTASSGSGDIYARSLANIAQSASNVALMRWLGGSAPSRSPLAGGMTGAAVPSTRIMGGIGGNNLAPLLLLAVGVYFIVSKK